MNFEKKLVHVRSKKHWGFEIKDREQRDVPLPDALATVLKVWFLEHGCKGLVLGTNYVPVVAKRISRRAVEDGSEIDSSPGKPNYHLLRLLKRTARKAGLNCGRCDGCRGYRECEDYTLHSFRRTYATTVHRSGVDVRTVQSLLGHADVETTLKYLAPMHAEQAHVKVNEAFV